MKRQGEEAPIVKYINKLLIDAIRMGHQIYILNLMKKCIGYAIVSMAFYVNCNTAATTGKPFASRLKVMSQMDISEKRVPQDGRIKLKLSKTKLSTSVLTHSLPCLAKNWFYVF